MQRPSRKSWLIFGAGFVACLACMIALLVSSWYFWLRPMQENVFKRIAPPQELSAPQPAAFDITAVGRNSAPLNLRDYHGRVIVLNIWATWCAPCIAELPTLSALAHHYSSDEDVAVICLSEEPAGKIFQSRAAQETHAPIYSLIGHPLPGVYKTNTIPATFVIDKRGMIVARHIGMADWSAPSVIAFIGSLRQRTDTEPERSDGP